MRNLMPHSTAWGLQSLWAVLVNFWEGCGEGEKYFLIWTLEEDSWLPCSQHSYESAAQGIANSYPSVFLDLPITGESCQLLPLWTVWKLEKARKHPSVLLSVWKDGILEIDSMRQEVIVLIHPNGKKGGKSCRLDSHGVYHLESRVNRRLWQCCQLYNVFFIF